MKNYFNLIDNYYVFEINVDLKFNSLILFTSGWGKEWTLNNVLLEDYFSFANESGRSSNYMPYFSLQNNDEFYDFAIGISSNYKVEFLKENNFLKTKIKYLFYFDKEVEYVPYVLIDHCFNNQNRYLKKHEYMESILPKYQKIGPIYNHWWAYEDKINADILYKNALISKELGLERLVLDAGWFGSSDWNLYRGDWKDENSFFGDVKEFSLKIINLDLKLGIWCEIEGLGEKSSFKPTGNSLDYVDLSYLENQAWAYNTLAYLFDKYKATYLKLDFNLDPKGKNLHFHYEGLYNVLKKVLKNYPDVIIENCSSGGQRFDVEMCQYAHVNFLSDVDEINHHLNCFNYASLWLHPKRLLHFVWSNTVETNNSSPFVNLDFSKCSEKEILYYFRSVFMHQWGISHRLIDYDFKTLNNLKNVITEYDESIFSKNFYIIIYSKDLKIFGFYEESTTLFIFVNKKQKFYLKNNDFELFLELSDFDSKIIEIKTNNLIKFEEKMG